jgi:hypothetical protein
MALMPDSIPEATADAFSNSVCIQGTSHALSGNGEEIISMQPVAFDIIVFLPKALHTNRTASTSPQPEHARCPEVI